MRLALPLFIVVVLIAAGFFWINRPQLITINAAVARDFPATGFSHQSFESLLANWVNAEGDVDYDGWHRSPEAMANLDSYLAAVSAYSPESSPERFPSRNDALAYWLFAYNAYVMRSVLVNWPLDSVTDLKAPIEVVKGMGFFYRLRFRFGGQDYSLYKVENEIIRKQYKDPRIHFVLNCGSESCPVIRPQLPTGDALELMLAQAATEFVNDPANVSVDHNAKTIYLSSIFKWYEGDYLNWLHANGRPASDLVDYVRPIAVGTLASDLANAENYTVAFREFDWAVNASTGAVGETTQ